MSFNVLAIPSFERQLKRLSKKYPSLKQEFFELIESVIQRLFVMVFFISVMLLVVLLMLFDYSLRN